MTDKEILNHVDHTLLSPSATADGIEKILREADEFGCASACIPPSYVAYAQEFKKKNGLKIPVCTVVGFPLGYSTTEAKVLETRQAIEEGAEEIDIVIPIFALKNGDTEYVKKELKALREASAGKILKVIIETCLLSEEEKILMCKLVTECGADYIKTSTGFGSAGATMEDILLFKKHIGKNVKIKAAGGIKTRKEMTDYLDAGVDRLGTSRAVSLLTE